MDESTRNAVGSAADWKAIDAFKASLGPKPKTAPTPATKPEGRRDDAR